MPEPKKKAVVRHPIGTNGSALNFVVCCCLYVYICLIVCDESETDITYLPCDANYFDKDDTYLAI